MPIAFEDLIARADSPHLANLLPEGAAKLLTAIDRQLAYPRNMVKVLLALKTPADLLNDAPSRGLIMELLPREEARRLAILLGATAQTDPYSFLQGARFTRQPEIETLFSFLGVGLREEEDMEVGPSDTYVEASYPLFIHQINALREVTSLLERNPHRVLLHMPTGAGKTRMAMNIVAEFLRNREKGVVVWLAHSEELCQQAAAEFEKAWKILGNRQVRVARFWGEFDSNLTDLFDGIVIAGLAKAFSRLRSDDRHFRALSSRNPFVVMDEAHQAVAATYKQIIDLLVRPTTKARLLGLSATPGRTWNDVGADEALSNFFSRNKVTLKISGYDNPVKYLIDQGYLADPKFRRINVDSQLELTPSERRVIEETFDLPRAALERLGRHEERNLQIILEVERLLQRHLRVIVFAASVEQSDLLAAVLAARGKLAASVSSRSSSSERASAIAVYSGDDNEARVICNYGVLTTGFDAPKTSAALIARPTYSLVLYSQMIGRAMRGPKVGGNRTAEIVTVIDTALPGFNSVESAFSNWEDVWKQT